MKSVSPERDLGRWRGPLWLRVAALLCVFLLLGASTAQVCHSHDDGSSLTKGSPVNVPTDHCPLCLAMHTALPAMDQSVLLVEQAVQEWSGETTEPGRADVWSPGQFSRPPPARS